MIENFRLEQRVYFQDTCIGEWFFTFGYVIAGSTNTWQHVIDAAPPDQMIPPEALSGNVIFETIFFDGKDEICRNRVRIFYA